MFWGGGDAVMTIGKTRLGPDVEACTDRLAECLDHVEAVLEEGIPWAMGQELWTFERELTLHYRVRMEVLFPDLERTIGREPALLDNLSERIVAQGRLLRVRKDQLGRSEWERAARTARAVAIAARAMVRVERRLEAV
jgi:hypothetical protein